MSPITTLPQTSLEDAIWDQIAGTAGISAILGASAARLFQGAIPNGAAFPYVLLRLETPRTREDYPGQWMSDLFIEAMAFGRPRNDPAKVTQLNTLSDLLQDALRNLVLHPAVGGMIKVATVGSQTLPEGTDDVDANVIQKRITAEGIVLHLPPA
jgi:hypothetical protein